MVESSVRAVLTLKSQLSDSELKFASPRNDNVGSTDNTNDVEGSQEPNEDNDLFLVHGWEMTARSALKTWWVSWRD